MAQELFNVCIIVKLAGSYTVNAHLFCNAMKCQKFAEELIRDNYMMVVIPSLLDTMPIEQPGWSIVRLREELGADELFCHN